MITEKKRMEAWGKGNGTIGHISLEKLADPSTVKVMLLGEELIPSSFSIYGEPNFTEQQEMLFMYKEEEIRRSTKDFKFRLEAEVTYEERIFDVPRAQFDTVQGIRRSLSNLEMLNEMLENRRLFSKVYGNSARLNEFMLFGCFWLDTFGQIMSVEKTTFGKLKVTRDIERYEEFCANNGGFTLTSGGYNIPKADSICPCCGKKITIEDIKNNPCVYEEGEMHHDACLRNYKKLTEIDKFTRRLMDLIYKEEDYTFDLLPNGYCSQYCCSHKPWFMFHTPDGDIEMGWRKRVISIEWQENYKPFDMELFKDEDVTKWGDKGKRGIHAWGNEKAYQYLATVLKAVNPEYKKY